MPSSSVGNGSVDVVRKTTACLACRKRKVRCHMVNDHPPCTRCKHRDIECEFNKSLDTLLQNDAEWKKRVEKRLDAIESLLDTGDASTSTGIAQGTAQIRREIDTSAALTSLSFSSQPDNTSPGLNLSCSLSSFPAVPIHGTTQDDSPHAVSVPAGPESSLRSPVALQQSLLIGAKAQSLFRFYQETLDPLIHYVLADGESLNRLRKRSEFLAVAVCTVASYCTGGLDHNEWLEVYKSMALARTFATQHAFDDVRALCIGAFWLTHSATALNALDHHCTLCYGRPPMTHELPCMENIRAFLGSAFSNPNRGDSSLISQVELWSTSTKVFDAFGADIEGTSPSYVDGIDRFRCLYEEWFNEWRPVLSPMGHLLRGHRRTTAQSSMISDFVLGIYYSAAKLQLYSHIFRGPAQRIPHPPIAISNRSDLSKFLKLALHCAVNQLDALTSILTSGSTFGILPAYSATTTAFSSLFLSRLLTAQSHALVSEDDKTMCIETMKRVCETSRVSSDKTIADTTDNSNSQTLLSKIVNTLKPIIEKSCGNGPHLNTNMVMDSSADGPRGIVFSPHASHDFFDIDSFNAFDVDMSLNFDFNLPNENSFAWGEGGGQAT